MIWRIANALRPNVPINVDRVLGGSYNTRSALEALIAHTPEFSYCYPGRFETINGKTNIKKGHKHLVWTPENPHENGAVRLIETDVAISEIPMLEARYEALTIGEGVDFGGLDINASRRHAQIQIALYHIGLQLGYRTWIAQNDKGIIYRNKRIAEYPGVIASLDDEKLLSSWSDAIKAALLIDCIWFKNGKLMPAVMEVEHTTGVTSGLTRMLKFKKALPVYGNVRYVIVAPDDDREKVRREGQKELYKELEIRFFPYSAVEELYAICERRKLKGVTEEFLDCYMEKVA